MVMLEEEGSCIAAGFSESILVECLMTIMRCLYEVLNIPQDANDESIRRAYRQQALKWHPDKNTSEEAETRFKEITNAFEVLSDPQERAWYDTHRESILRSGTTHQAGDNSTGGFGNLPELYQYFTGSCYSGYHTGPDGFYSVYGKVFDEIACREAQEGKENAYVMFGNEESTDQEISRFYAYWTSFTSVIDFAFMDEFNPGSAPNRRVRRAMEDQNAKRRKAAKKEYVETVRELAKFVKKRDVRVLRMQKEEGERRAQNRAEEERRRKEAEEERRRKAAEYRDAEWIAAGESNAEEQEELSEESVTEQLWCVVCDKVFKSDRALENHEKSKKHREAVALLEKQLAEEENQKEQSPEETSSEISTNHEEDFSKVESIPQVVKKVEEEVSGSDLDEEAFIAQFSQLSSRNQQENSDDFEQDDRSQLEEESVSRLPAKTKKSRRGNRRKKKEQIEVKSDLSDVQLELQCETCNEVFSTRNQLFKHLRQTKHASTKL